MILKVRARGQYGIRIENSRLFIAYIIGVVPNGTIQDYSGIWEDFNGLINAKIKSVTAQYMIKKKISFLEISMYLSELSDKFNDEINKEFERFGIEIVNFYCESIEPRPEDYEELRKRKQEQVC